MKISKAAATGLGINLALVTCLQARLQMTRNIIVYFTYTSSFASCGFLLFPS